MDQLEDDNATGTSATGRTEHWPAGEQYHRAPVDGPIAATFSMPLYHQAYAESGPHGGPSDGSQPVLDTPGTIGHKHNAELAAYLDGLSDASRLFMGYHSLQAAASLNRFDFHPGSATSAATAHDDPASPPLEAVPASRAPFEPYSQLPPLVFSNTPPAGDVHPSKPERPATATAESHRPVPLNSSRSDEPGLSLGRITRRKRRTYEEMERSICCPVSRCTKVYGSEAALKTHLRMKHSSEFDMADYVPREEKGRKPMLLQLLPSEGPISPRPTRTRAATRATESPTPPPVEHPSPVLLPSGPPVAAAGHAPPTQSPPPASYGWMLSTSQTPSDFDLYRSIFSALSVAADPASHPNPTGTGQPSSPEAIQIRSWLNSALEYRDLLNSAASHHHQQLQPPPGVVSTFGPSVHVAAAPGETFGPPITDNVHHLSDGAKGVHGTAASGIGAELNLDAAFAHDGSWRRP